jgi:hypothetical protein
MPVGERGRGVGNRNRCRRRREEGVIYKYYKIETGGINKEEIIMEQR